MLVVMSFCKSWVSFRVARVIPSIVSAAFAQGGCEVVSNLLVLSDCVFLAQAASSKLDTILTMAVDAAVSLSISSLRSKLWLQYIAAWAVFV